MRVKEEYRIDTTDRDDVVVHFHYIATSTYDRNETYTSDQRLYVEKANLLWLIETIERHLLDEIAANDKVQLGIDTLSVRASPARERTINAGCRRDARGLRATHNIIDGESWSGFDMTIPTAIRLVNDLSDLLPPPADGSPRPVPYGPPAPERVRAICAKLSPLLQVFEPVVGGRYDTGVRFVRQRAYYDVLPIGSYKEFRLQIGRQATPASVSLDATLIEVMFFYRERAVATQTAMDTIEARVSRLLGSNDAYHKAEWKLRNNQPVELPHEVRQLLALQPRLSAVKHSIWSGMHHMVEGRHTPAEATTAYDSWDTELKAIERALAES